MANHPEVHQVFLCQNQLTYLESGHKTALIIHRLPKFVKELPQTTRPKTKLGRQLRVAFTDQTSSRRLLTELAPLLSFSTTSQKAWNWHGPASSAEEHRY